MGRAAVRDFWEDEIIPAGFYLWLQANRFVPHSFIIPLGGSSVENTHPESPAVRGRGKANLALSRGAERAPGGTEGAPDKDIL